MVPLPLISYRYNQGAIIGESGRFVKRGDVVDGYKLLMV
jgi:hypothetical protein